MIQRSAVLRVARLAGEVLEASGARSRVEEGYTRVDPIDIAERAGVQVMAQPMDKLLGAFLREEQVGILLNTLRPTGMFHMTCAHELGHFYLGHLTTTDEHLDYQSNASDFELEADQFAYALMAPLWLVVQVLRTQGWGWGSLKNPRTLYQLSLRLGLSYAGTVWSLARHNKLDYATARDLVRVKPAHIKSALVPQGTQLDPNRDVWQLSPRDKDLILEPRLNDHIVIDLPSHAAAGYLWSLSEVVAEGYALRPLTIESDKEAALAEAALPVGAAPTSRYALRFEMSDDSALQTTPTTVEFMEVQPWRPQETDSATGFAFQTKFETTKSGLSEGCRNRLLLGAQ